MLKNLIRFLRTIKGSESSLANLGLPNLGTLFVHLISLHSPSRSESVERYVPGEYPSTKQYSVIENYNFIFE